MRRGGVGVAIAALAAGFAAAALALSGYLTLARAGGGERQVEVHRQIQERNGRRGEIAAAGAAINDRIAAARVPSRRLRGDINIRLHRAVWTDGSRPAFLRAERVIGRLNMGAAERGDIVVDGLVLTRANVRLEQLQRGGQWNYERVLADLLNGGDQRGGSSGGGPDDTVLLTNVRMQDSRVEIHEPNDDLAFESLNFDASRILLDSPRTDAPEIDLRTLSTTYVDLRDRKRISVKAEGARLRIPDDRVDFVSERVALGTLRAVSVEGRWQPSRPGIGLSATGRALDSDLASMAFFSDRLPTRGRASFTFSIRSLEDGWEVRLTHANIRSEGSQLRGAVAVNTGEPFQLLSVDMQLDPMTIGMFEKLSGSDVPYVGTLAGTVRGTNGNLGFDLVASLTAEGVERPFETRLTGLARLAGGAFTLQRTQVALHDVPVEALRPITGGLPFKGDISGTVSLRGPPDRAPLALDVLLELAGGTAAVRGTLDLTGEQPVYDLAGRVTGVSLQRLFEPAMPPALLTADFTLRGRSFQAELADAQFTMNGSFSGWGSEPDDTVAIAARVRHGSLAVDRALVLLGPVELETQGEWRFVAPETGALRYRFAIADLRPVAPYLPALPNNAAGTLMGSGTIGGSLERTRIAGELGAGALKFDGWGADTLALTHALVLGDSIPAIRVDANASGITTPTAGRYTTAKLKLQLESPVFALDLHADRSDGGLIEVVADGRVPYSGARRIVLQRVRMDLGTGRWALAQPASIDWGYPDGAVNVHNLQLRAENGEGRLLVDGRVLPLAQVDARVETEALPLEEIQRLLGRRPRLTGALWAKADVRGPGTAPTFDVEFHVDSGKWEGVGFQQFKGEVEYRGQLLAGNVTVTFDTAGTLEARAALPMRIVFAPKVDFDALDYGTVSGSLKADSLALAAVQGFFPEVQDAQGVVRANATLTGTVANPVLAGSINMTNGAMTVLPLDQRYTEIAVDIEFDQRSADIRTLRARSDGWLNVSGRVEFPEIHNPVADLTLTLNRFRVAGVEDRKDAATRGEVRITGPVSRPLITGQVTFEDGDVPIPRFDGGALDTELAALGAPLEIEGPDQADRGFFENVRIEDLRITAGSGLWFSTRNARAQMTGNLTINKRNSDVAIVGTLEGQRGSYTLEAGPILRRFEIVNIEVNFRGNTPIDPAIDITARRVLVDETGREMEVQVRIGGTLESPTLSLASQTGTQIPQSELLSYLLFGQQTLGLERGSLLPGGSLPGGALFEETYLSGVTELLSLEIEDVLGAPFDLFQIRLGGGYGGLGSPTFVIGRELTNDLFLTVESGISALFGPSTQDGVTSNTWAVRLEWRIDPRTSLRVGYEPVNRGRLIRGIGVALPLNREQQAALELRKRWTW
jgi:translocation-and-assembly-module (TAM) inner membrane subunit TamB-like protein